MAPGLAPDLNAYLDYLKFERNLSPKTLENYQRQIRLVAEASPIDSWTDLSRDILKRAVFSRDAAKLSPRTLALRLSAVRSFCQFLVEQGRLNQNPAKGIKAPKQGKALPKQLHVEDMQQLLQIPQESLLAVRDKAMLDMTYGCGLRLAELTNLNLNHLNRDLSEVRVLGKGNKERLVPIGRMTRQSLQAWLKVRGQLAPNDEPALFVSMQARRISPRQIAQRMNYWAKRMGMSAKVHPHKLRHSFASHLLQSSGDLRGVQELLGHANLSTTQVYTHLDFQHLASVYDQAHPRAKRRSG